MTWFNLFKGTLCAVLMLGLVGCGGGTVSDYQLPQTTNVPTAKENVKTWLTGVAEAGELDSGAEIMGEQFDKLAQEGVDLKEDFEKLKSTKGSSAIKSLAQSMLSKL